MSLSTLKMKRASLTMDRISDLPDQLLTHILSLLPTEEVVRTCVLSKRWKRVWASVPVLVFDDHKSISHKLTEEEFLKRDTKFLALVIGVLHHREALPLDTFELNWFGKFDVSYPLVSGILSSFISFMPRVLSIHTFTVDFFNLPDSIFTCASVEEMSLEVQTDNGHDYFIETESINLPRLKKLTLGNVSISNDFIGMLLSGCPVLEELVFSWCLFDIDEISSPILKKLTTKYCSQDQKMEISCPGVMSLSIGSFSSSAAITLKNMTSLVTANFFFDDLYNSDDHDLKLLGGLSNVANLTICTISPSIMESLAADIRNCPALNNLKSLEFGEMDMNLDWNSVVRLLQQSPNLTTLTLVFCQPSEEVGQGTLGNVSFQREYLETVKIRCEDKSAEFVEEVIRTLGVVIKSIGEVIIL